MRVPSQPAGADVGCSSLATHHTNLVCVGYGTFKEPNAHSFVPPCDKTLCLEDSIQRDTYRVPTIL